MRTYSIVRWVAARLMLHEIFACSQTIFRPPQTVMVRVGELHPVTVLGSDSTVADPIHNLAASTGRGKVHYLSIQPPRKTIPQAIHALCAATIYYISFGGWVASSLKQRSSVVPISMAIAGSAGQPCTWGPYGSVS